MISGGQIFVSSPPTFSNDGKKLFVCTGCTVSIFSTSTGMQINELRGGHTDRVTSVVVLRVTAASSKFMSYCWTSSLDGTICHWDFTSAELIKKVDVKLPIRSMVIPNISTIGTGGEASKRYAFVSVEGVSTAFHENKVVCGQIQIFNLTKSCHVRGMLGKTRKPELLSVSKNGEFVGIANRRKIHIWMIPLKDFRFEEIKKIKLHHTKNLTCLAFHPSLRMVAGGDATGRILIWIGFGRRRFARDSQITSGAKNAIDEEKPGVWRDDDAASCSTWHWHSSAVKFLFFSSDGAYLYSGGKEGVIVVWQLDTGKKKFKPRLGSPLLYFTQSPDSSLSCVSCSDNRIHLLKMPTMEITKSISGIKPPFLFPVEHESYCTRVAYDLTAGIAAVPTGEYCVQFYNLFDNHEVSEVQVCKRNFQPADDVMLYVALISISDDGSLMGTVDVRLPEESLGEFFSLKFWMRSSLVGEYSLSTVIYEPHSDAGVSCLAFRPGHGMAISTSFGGEFKVWVHGSHITTPDSLMQRTGWRCQSVGSYKEKPLSAAAFSSDGSVLAIAAETVITLWDPDTNALVAVIGDTHSPIKQLSFIGKTEYLVSLTCGLKPQLAVWRTTNLGLYWSYKLVAEALSSSPDESQFAVLVLVNSPYETHVNEDGVILLFDVENPVPVAAWMVKKANGGSLAFLPANTCFRGTEASATQKAFMLVYMNRDHEYIIFDPHSHGDYRTCKYTQDGQLNIDEAERFGYASIYGDLSKLNSKQEQVPEITFVPSERPWETIFSGSSHILPPLTKLCSTFLASLLEKRPIIKDSYASGSLDAVME